MFCLTEAKKDSMTIGKAAKLPTFCGRKSQSCHFGALWKSNKLSFFYHRLLIRKFLNVGTQFFFASFRYARAVVARVNTKVVMVLFERWNLFVR